MSTVAPAIPQRSGKQPMKKLSAIAIAVAGVIALGACSKSETPKQEAKAPAAAPAATTPAASAPAPQAAQPKPVAKGDSSVPFDAYVELKSGNQLMFAYLGLDSMPVDYERVTRELSADYRATSDEFKKRDIQKALTPRIDQEIEKAKAKGARYVRLDNDAYGLVGKYNFDSKSFPIIGMDTKDGYRYFRDNPSYRLTFANGGEFSSVPVPDEAKAREVESLRARTHEWKSRIYLFLSGTEIGQTTVTGEIMKIQILDMKGNVVLEK